MSSGNDTSGAVHDLGLNFDDEEHPCRLLAFPSNPATPNGAEYIAYGGEDGLITSTTAVSSSHTETPTFSKAITLRTFDDAVRAVAVSDDGKRVAVGFQSGKTTIYKYDDHDSKASKHTFLKPLPGNDFSSQIETVSPSLDEMGDEDDDELRQMPGPELEAPVRDLVFLPSKSSSGSRCYYLGIASEHSFCVVDVASAATIRDGGRHLEQECNDHHNGGGIRGLAYDSSVQCLASLAMDGRLCLWDLGKTEPKQWKLALRETKKCIAQADTGEAFGATPWDRSCRPLLIPQTSDSCLVVTPGQLNPVVRCVKRSKDGFKLSVSEATLDVTKQQTTDSTATTNGHIEATVGLAWVSPPSSKAGNSTTLISSGRDGRLVRWVFAAPKNGDSNTQPILATSCTLLKEPSFPPVEVQLSTATAAKKTDALSLLLTSAKGTCQVIVAHQPSTAREAVNHQTTESQMDIKETQPPSTTAETAKQDHEQEDLEAMETQPTLPSKRELDEMHESLLDSDDEVEFDADDKATSAATSTTGSVRSKSPKKRARFVDDEAEEGSDDEEKDTSNNVGGQNKAAATNDNPEAGLEDLMHDHVDTITDVGVKPANMPTATQDDLDDSIQGKNDARGNGDDDDMSQTNDYGYDTAYVPLPNRTPSVPPQAPFAPSSTPLDLTRRFFCWNHIGAMTLLQDDEGGDQRQQRSTVDITFTDSAFRRPISFTDNQGFIMGSLGEDGGIFATDLREDDDNDAEDQNDLDDVVGGLKISERIKEAVRQSRKKRRFKEGGKGGKDFSTNPTGSSIYFHRFNTFGLIRDKDWYITLPDGERALGTSCGEGWAAVATSRRFLRFFSSGGNQNQLIWLPGDVVSMAGRSRYLTVMYHINSPKQDGTQQLGFSLYDAVSFQLLASGPASCISNESSLSWLGFSNDSSALAMDTDGMMSMLVPTKSENGVMPKWEWAPMLDTIGLRKSADDQFWPITVHDGKLVCVPLKGGNQYPDASRRPVTTSLNLRLPLARRTNAKSTMLEEVSVRSNLALSHKKTMNEITSSDADEETLEKEYAKMSAQVDKVTLKLFASIVDAGKLERALDLVDRLHIEKSYDIAATIAGRHTKLVELIEDARDAKFAYPEDDEDDDGYDIEDDDDRPPRMASKSSAKPSPVSPDNRLFKFSANPIQKKQQRPGIF